MSRDISKITLSQFLKEINEKDSTNIINDSNFVLLKFITMEGFTENEALEMDINKVWELFTKQPIEQH